MKELAIRRKNHPKAFSLVEVVLAMGIGAIALVTLIGLIPGGLRMMRDAADEAIEGRIHQQILSEMQMTPFRDKSNNPNMATSPLKAFHRQLRVYDTQGVELGVARNGSGALTLAPGVNQQDVEIGWAYSARIWLPFFEGSAPPSVGKGGVNSAGLTGTSAQELLTVIVEIVPFQIPGTSGTASVTSRLSNFEPFLNDPANFKRIHTFQTTLARMGMDFSN